MKLKFPRPAILVLIVVLIIVVAGFYFSDVLTLQNLKSSYQYLATQYQQNPVTFVAGFAALNTALIALYVPGPALLSVAAGALFGFWLAFLIIAVSSALGATLALWLARTLFRDAVRRRFSTQFARVNEGIKKDGWLYFLTLRMFPGVPFALVNLMMGVTAISKRLFFAITLIGMIPGNVVFTYAGTRLRSIHSLADVLSLETMLTFLLLSLTPLALKLASKALRKYLSTREIKANTPSS